MTINKNELQNDRVEHFISYYPLQNVRVLEKSEITNDLIKSIKGNESESLFMLAAAISSVAQKEKVELLLAITEQSISKEKAEAIFKTINHQSRLCVPQSLKKELFQIIQTGKAEERGFIYDSKSKKYSFNANVFVKHLKKRCNIRSKKDGRVYLYNKAGLYEELSEVELGKVIRTVMHEGLSDSWTNKSEQEIVKALQREVEIVNDMNVEKNVINVKNGILSLETFKLIPHDPKYLSTVQLPINYDHYASAPKFMKYIREITMNDEELIRVLQEIIGYLLSSETKAEKAFFFYGGGANGKSVLAFIISYLVGEKNMSSIPLSNFDQPFGLEGIIDKNINLAAENEMGCKALKTENFKAIVSGDSITINRKYYPAISYKPHCKLVFLVNNLPDSMDVTNGFFRKILIIPFRRSFGPNERNVNLSQELLCELPGILNWALKGLMRLRENNYRFSYSDAIEQCFQGYYLEQNPVKQFFNEHIKVEQGGRTKQSEFHEKYLQWLNLQGIDDKGTKSKQIFWKNLKIVFENESIKIVRKKIKGIYYFDGIKIEGLENSQYPILDN